MHKQKPWLHVFGSQAGGLVVPEAHAMGIARGLVPFTAYRSKGRGRI